MNDLKEKGKHEGLTGPVVAHCSAGIGRTGSFFGILLALEKLSTGTDISEIGVKQIVCDMRKQRAGMVQTDEQYIFIHKVLRDFIVEDKFQAEQKETDKNAVLQQPEMLGCGCPSLSEKPWRSRKHANDYFSNNESWAKVERRSLDESTSSYRQRCVTIPEVNILRTSGSQIPCLQ
jgi:Rad3-related DNA helicase